MAGNSSRNWKISNERRIRKEKLHDYNKRLQTILSNKNETEYQNDIRFLRKKIANIEKQY